MALPAPAIYALGILTTRAISLISLPIVSRSLGPESWGQLDLLVTMADLTGLVVGLGLVEATQRALALARADGDAELQRRRTAEGCGTILLVILILGSILQLLAPTLHTLTPAGVTVTDVRLALATGCGSALLTLPLMVLRSNGRAWHFVSFNFSIGALQTILTLAAVLNGYGITAVLASGTFAHLLGCTGMLIYLGTTYGIALRPTAARQLVTYGAPLAFGACAAFCYHGLDRWILSAWVSPEELGGYSAAVRISMLCAMAFQPFQLWWSPRRLEWLAGGDQQRYATGATLGVIWIIGVVLALSSLAPWVAWALFGEAFDLDRAALTMLLITIGTRGAADALNGACYLEKSSWKPMAIQWTSAIVTVLLVSALVPTWGVPGAAAGLLGGSIVRLGLFLYTAQAAVRIVFPGIRLATLAGAVALASFLPTSVASLAVMTALGLVALSWAARTAMNLRATAA